MQLLFPFNTNTNNKLNEHRHLTIVWHNRCQNLLQIKFCHKSQRSYTVDILTNVHCDCLSCATVITALLPSNNHKDSKHSLEFLLMQQKKNNNYLHLYLKVKWHKKGHFRFDKTLIMIYVLTEAACHSSNWHFLPVYITPTSGHAQMTLNMTIPGPLIFVIVINNIFISANS